MGWAFKANSDTPVISSVPFIEEARADFAPYYSSGKSAAESIKAVQKELGKLGARVLQFTDGTFTIDGQERLGYEIRFLQGNASGLIRIAGLPIRSWTAVKERQVRVQALLVVRDWLKAAVTGRLFNPDMHPLLPFLLLPDGRTTIAEYITSGAVLALPDGSK